MLIINCTLTLTFDSKTLYKVLINEFSLDLDNRPSVLYFYVLSYKTYIQILKEQRTISKKVKVRTKVRILVGYKGNYIFKVYILIRLRLLELRIIRSLNVRFDESRLITEPYSDGDNDDEPKYTFKVSRGKGNQDY